MGTMQRYGKVDEAGHSKGLAGFVGTIRGLRVAILACFERLGLVPGVRLDLVRL